MPKQFEILVRVRIEAANQSTANEHAAELVETVSLKLREQDAGGRIESFQCDPLIETKG